MRMMVRQEYTPLRTILERARLAPKVPAIVYQPGDRSKEVAIGYGELAEGILRTAAFLRRELARHDRHNDDVVAIIAATTPEALIVEYASRLAGRVIGIHPYDDFCRIPMLLRCCNVKVVVLSSHFWDAKWVEMFREQSVQTVFTIDGPAQEGCDGRIEECVVKPLRGRKLHILAGPPIYIAENDERGRPYSRHDQVDDVGGELSQEEDEDLKEACGFDWEGEDVTPDGLRKAV